MNIQLKGFIDSRQSFILYAGAGSGKTYALVELLRYVEATFGKQLNAKKCKVAVITYTNAATDEIKRRVEYSEMFAISTIHSFLWEVIRPFQDDIKQILQSNIRRKKEEQEAKRRTASVIEKINKCEERLNIVDGISQFIYNPNGDNIETNSLNHSEVIAIGSQMIGESPLLQSLIAQRYPFFFIDESQDTNKDVMIALLKMEENNHDKQVMGLFGDVKQRIYLDGLPDIEKHIPTRWGRSALVTNYRSDKRIVKLANAIAKEIQSSDQAYGQSPRDEAGKGYAHLFLVDANSDIDRDQKEVEVCRRMSALTGDLLWESPQDVKMLTLEHKMAARRIGFSELFEKLYQGRYKDDFLRGELPGSHLLMKVICPIIDGEKAHDEVQVSDIIRSNCSLLDSKMPSTLSQLKEVATAYQILRPCLTAPATSIGDCINTIIKTKLFAVPDVLETATSKKMDETDDAAEELTDVIDLWRSVKDIPLEQFYRYYEYVSNHSRFATHQGVKGLEYDRVMAVYDDFESKGNTFSFEKSFGAAGLSERDLQNKAEGKETTLERTMRLIYVTCTRPKKSLALVVYTKAPQTVKQNLMSKGWFERDEIEEI